MTDLMIVGGGAAGLMAAICFLEECSQGKVKLLEAGERVGKKLLSTGNGRCNLTNLRAAARDYAPADVSGVLNQLPPQRLIEKMEEMGLPCREESEGRVYPASDAASSVLDTLRLTAEHLGAEEVTGFEAVRVRRDAEGFVAEAADGRRERAKLLLLATGGRAASKFAGYDLARALGHSVTPLIPALLPFKTDAAAIKGLNGVRCKCAATLLCGGKHILREEGEVLFKDYGLSGIAIFQLSRALARQKKDVQAEVELDLLPGMTDAQAEAFLFDRAERLGWRQTDAFFLGMFHKNIAMNLLRAAGIGSGMVEDVTTKQLKVLAHLLKHWGHRVLGTQGSFQSAQVTVGGVPLREADSESLESKKCPGLYLAGELLDADGPCGGYNLTWAFASGAAAGKHAAQALRK